MRWLAALALLGLQPACGNPAAPTPASRPSRPPVDAPAPSPRPAPPAPSSPRDEPPAPEPLPPRRDGMLLIPGGTFTMGADEGGEADEHPAHRVTVSSFYLDETEVTNEAYQPCVDAGTCEPPYAKSAALNGYGADRAFRAPRQPVSAIRWFDADAFCRFLGNRLPTEAEWERAARGDDGRRFPWGNEAPDATRGRYRSRVTVEVGQFPAGAGPYGHLDLAGNVWEWVADPYHPLAYTTAKHAEGRVPTCDEAEAAYDELRTAGKQGFTGSNPIPSRCERVLRGGAFNYFPQGLRATNRVHHEPEARLVMSGFRCAADP